MYSDRKAFFEIFPERDKDITELNSYDVSIRSSLPWGPSWILEGWDDKGSDWLSFHSTTAYSMYSPSSA